LSKWTHALPPFPPAGRELYREWFELLLEAHDVVKELDVNE
jgi:hypothetical protein